MAPNVNGNKLAMRHNAELRCTRLIESGPGKQVCYTPSSYRTWHTGMQVDDGITLSLVGQNGKMPIYPRFVPLLGLIVRNRDFLFSWTHIIRTSVYNRIQHIVR
jgi:hypothetical protein